jgi:SAM-dependent methyltransferase
MNVSSWVNKNYKLIKKQGLVLDLACGSGRHGRFLLEKGFQVVFLDKDISNLRDLKLVSGAQLIKFNLENGSSLPFPMQKFDAVLVTNYLHRPLFKSLLSVILDGGLLIYETFARGNEVFGRPSNSNYLLEPEELIDLVRPTLRVISFQEGYVNEGRKAVVQRVVAVKPGISITPNTIMS